MAHLFRNVFAPLLSRLHHANRHYGLGLLVASCIGTRARMGLLSRKAISGVFDQPYLGTISVTPAAPSPTLIITPDQEPYVRKLLCAPSFAKAVPPKLHWRRLPTEPTHEPPSHQKDSQPAGRPPLLDLGDKAGSPLSFKDIPLTQPGESLDLLQFPEAITTAFDSDNDSGAGSDSNGAVAASARSSASSSDSSKAVVGTVFEDRPPSSPLGPPSTPPPTPQSPPLVPPGLGASGFVPLDSPAFVGSGILLENPLGLVARGPSQGSAPPPSFLVLSDGSDADADYWAALNTYTPNPARYADQVTSPFDTTYAIPCGVGEGASGRLVLGIETQTARCVAIKVLHKRSCTRRMSGQVQAWTMEKRFLQIGRERQITHWVQMLESWHDEHNVYFVMELAFGSLRDKMLNNDYDHIEAKLWCREMLCAVEALREHHVVHSDIKPDNFLIVQGGSVVLSDFGMAQTPEPALPSIADFLEWRAFPGGTPGYYAPQTLRKEDRYVSHATDIFSLGVVFAELLSHMCGELLWDVFRVPPEHADTRDVWMAIPQAARQKWLMDNYWLSEVKVSPESPEMDLIERMLKMDASVDELLAHRLFDELLDSDGKVKYRHTSPQTLPPLRVEPEMRDLMFEAWHRGVQDKVSYGPVRPSFAPVMNGSRVLRSRWLKDSAATKLQLRQPFPSDFNWTWPPPEREDEPEPADKPEPADESPSPLS